MNPTVWINGQECEATSTALGELLVNLGLRLDVVGVAVALNESVVPRGLWMQTPVQPGDRIEIVGATQGG